MVVSKPRGVRVIVSPNFFDNVFEKERRKLETKTGVRMTQMNFTEILARKKVKFIFPKQDKKFLPKQLKLKRRK